MMLKDLVEKNRSVRRFRQDQTIPMDILKELIALARLCPSSANRQPLKYVLCNDAKINAGIFEHLAWAGYLRDWPGPQEGERPAAYIIICGDHNITSKFGCDHGIAAQTIMLGAVEKGLSGCIIGSIKKDALSNFLNLNDNLEILLVLALGVAREKVVIEALPDSKSIEYWRDNEGVHHVPKRQLDELIVHCYKTAIEG